ncbi:MAG: hypothetical protein ACOC7U_04670, partial [Spirochaetota bacterium]
FITAGSCGPCRFGMYEMEYRNAVQEAGFEGFKIIAFQQNDALVKDLHQMGFSMKRSAFKVLVQALMLGDMINNIYYRTKPYESCPGNIDQWKQKSLELLSGALRGKKSLVKTLVKVKRELSRIKLNYFQPKPVVKIIGEFFSQIQEGDANYRLPHWLIEQGAEPVVEPVSTWLDYIIRKRVEYYTDRAFRHPFKSVKMVVILSLLKAYVHFLYRAYWILLGRKPDLLVKQKKLEAYASAYYNPRIVGGEGHMEVSKHIYTFKSKKAHMVISVKPFGCMSSTQSDGVQTKVSQDIKDSLFVSVDTSGDAEVNFKSRVLMKLYEAKNRAVDEYENTKKKLDLNDRKLEQAYSKNPRTSRACILLPKKNICTAARVLHLV